MTAGNVAVLLGSPVDDVTLDEAIDRIAAMVRDGRSSGRVHQVATVNVDFVVNAHDDPVLLDVMQRTDLAIPDGMGVLWGARIVGTPLRTRVAGVDLVPALVERAVAEGWRVCLFGGAAGVAEEAAAMLGAGYPGVVGLPGPDVAADGSMDESFLDGLRAADADVVCAALGNPKQERWIDRYGTAVGAPVLIGIGGSLDFLTGKTRRAPHWMQRMGVEWIHRASSEPRRLIRRYARDIVVFGPNLARQRRAGRSRGSAVLPLVEVKDGVPIVQLLGRTPWWSLHATTRDLAVLRLDLSSLDHLDNTTIAAITSLRRQRRDEPGSVEVVGPSANLLADAARRGVDALVSPARSAP